MQFGNNDMVVHTQLANLFDVYGTDAKMLPLACAATTFFVYLLQKHKYRSVGPCVFRTAISHVHSLLTWNKRYSDAVVRWYGMLSVLYSNIVVILELTYELNKLIVAQN